MPNLEELKARLAHIKQRQSKPLIVIKPEPVVPTEEEDAVKEKLIALLVACNQDTEWLLREATQQLDPAANHSRESYTQLIDKLIEALPSESESPH